MCVTSMVGDHYRDQWSPKPWYQPMVGGIGAAPVVPISRSEFDDLKRQVEELKALLKRAKEYDDKNNEPECELDEKMAVLRKVAQFVGVDLDEALKPISK